MRTVILNTLDSYFTKKDVFYRAFVPEQILWLDLGLDELQACADQIIAHARRQSIRQDYHLVVLTDLEHFRFSEFADVRVALKHLITALLNTELLPRLEKEKMLPCRITEIFTYFRNRADTERGRNIYAKLFLPETNQPISRLALSYGRQKSRQKELDMSRVLPEVLQELTSSTELSSQAQKLPPSEEEDELIAFARKSKRAKEEEEATERLSVLQQHIDSLVRSKIEQLQVYKCTVDPDHPITPSVQELAFKMSEPSLANADLQINLSRLMLAHSLNETNSGHSDGCIVCCAHTAEELGVILANAEASVQCYLKAEARLDYYELVEPYNSNETGALEYAIRERLRKEVDTVPGIKEALDQLDGKEAPAGAAPTVGKTKLERKLRASWFLFGKEKRRFQESYRKLQEQYDRRRVLETQQQIFDICAGEFLDWRAKMRQGLREGAAKPTLARRPAVLQERHSALIQARERCAKGVLEQLNDFSDVRERAAELHTEFRALTRVWSPDRQAQNNGKFFCFSVTMALLFVLLMVLPFILIESMETGYLIPKLALYAIYYALFLALYSFGVLRWMHKLCKQLHALTAELDALLYHSADKRRESVLSAVETYGELLPQCLLQQLNLNVIERTDAQNDRLERWQQLHMGYLADATNEIQDLRTALRLPELPKGRAKTAKLNFSKPPYALENQSAYMLFYEEGERR